MSSVQDGNFLRHIRSLDEDVPSSPRSINDGSRDYYEDLFSPDTITDNSSMPEPLGHSPSTISSKFSFSNLSLLNDRAHKDGESFQSSSLSHTSTSNSGSDMDISDSSDSSSSLSSSSSTSQLKESRVDPVISFLDEDEIAHLLGENIPLPKMEQRETLEKENVDIIASFNVRNKYNHITAAELLIKEQISFLSIQEPYASSHKASESWKAYQKLELESARIACYKTPYQMILFDSWKWGGQILSPFQSLQYGRIASIAFDLGGKFKIGLISVYAPTRSANYKNLPEEQAHPPLQITNRLIQKILSKWKADHPDMLTMILGDLQETIDTSDRDNLGVFRMDPTVEGVVSGLQDTHTSIVRDMNPTIPYITRFGKEGARGIDHIFYPLDEKFKDVCVDAKIKRDIGANYFPSDHSLITCSISRKSQNNNCSGRGSTKYNYNKLFSIKLKQSGTLGCDLDFDTSQFKNCRKFKEQSDLYVELQKRTGPNSNLTKTHLQGLETRIEALFSNLWKDGVIQQVHGPSNNLVEISDAQAVELSFILNHFNSAIKTLMMDLKLMDEKNSNDSAGKTRGRLRMRKGLKLFNNLPIPTKLRYLRVNIEQKIRELQKNIYMIQENHIRKQHDPKYESDSLKASFWKQWKLILKDEFLSRKAKEVSDAYQLEATEQMLHVSAIKFETDKRKRNIWKQNQTLPNVSDNIVRLLNFWLAGSNCNQGFDANGKRAGSSAFLTERIGDWRNHLDGIDTEKTDLSVEA